VQDTQRQTVIPAEFCPPQYSAFEFTYQPLDLFTASSLPFRPMNNLRITYKDAYRVVVPGRSMRVRNTGPHPLLLQTLQF
jgi:hypothetical protein